MLLKYLFKKPNLVNTRNYSQILNVGDEVSVKRRITAADIRLFTEITKDTNPIHQDPVKGIVHGAFLNGLVSGVIGTKLPGNGTIVVEQFLKFPKPCYVDEEVTISVTIKSLRKIIEVEFEVFSEDDDYTKRTFLMGNAKLLVPWKDTNLRHEI